MCGSRLIVTSVSIAVSSTLLIVSETPLTVIEPCRPDTEREDAGGADDEAPRFGDLLHAFNLTHAVDVTAHEMAVDAVAEDAWPSRG